MASSNHTTGHIKGSHKRKRERVRGGSEQAIDKHQVKCQRVAERSQIIEQLIKHDIIEEEKKANHNNNINKIEI